MNDREIAGALRSILLPAMQATPDLYGIELARNFQPRQPGAPVGPTVFFMKKMDKRLGHPQRKNVYNVVTGGFDHTLVQWYESTYSFQALVTQDVADVTQLTESDILNTVANLIQSDNALQAFRAAGLGILRVTDVANPYIFDDRDRFAAEPQFDVVFEHERTLVSTVPAVVAYEANIDRV